MPATLRTTALVLSLALLLGACESVTGNSAGTNLDDASITASVKSKLVADRISNLTRVDVDTNRGTVYLIGTVASSEQKTRAEQLAWQAKGVKSVVNRLVVKQ